MSLYNPSPVTPHARAMAEDVNGELTKIKAAFDELQAYVQNYITNPPDPVSLFTWTAYANSADGMIDFTTGEPGSRSYIGLAFNRLVPTPSEIPSDYKWSNINGILGDFVAIDTLNVAGRPAHTVIADLDMTANQLLAYQFDRQTLRDYIDERLYVDGIPVNTVIVSESNQRRTADTALAETISLIGAKTPDASGFIIDLNKVYVGPDLTLSVRLSSIQSIGENAQAQINSLAQTIIEADYVSAATMSLLGAKNLDGTAFLLNLNTVKVSPTQTMGQYISQVVAEAAGDTVSVSDIREAVIDPVAGASAKAVLNLDVNGHVVSRTATNDGTTGKIVYKFDSFELQTPEGVSMFLAEDGVVKMHNVEVDKLKAGSITTDDMALKAVNNTVYHQRTNSLNLSKFNSIVGMIATITKQYDNSYIEIQAFVPTVSDNDTQFTATLNRRLGTGTEQTAKTYKIQFISDANTPTADASTLVHLDQSLPAGTYTYSMIFYNFNNFSGNTILTDAAILKVTEVKR